MKLPSIILRWALMFALLGLVSSARAGDDDSPASPPDGTGAQKPRDLGPPLVDDVKDLKQLGKFAAWLDPKNKQVVLVGETCKAGYGLEFLVTTKDRDYESVMVIDGRRHTKDELSIFKRIQLALLLLNAQPGKPARYDQKLNKTFVATGDEIAIEVRWKGKDGKTQSADARTFIRDMKTKKSPTLNWVFAGSRFQRDDEGKNHFLADSGDFICVLNNPVAMLDLPMVSASAIEDRMFEANADAMPPPETPVTILLKPVAKTKTQGKAEVKAEAGK